MFSNAMTMRVMAGKYRRLAEQQTNPHERDKYRAYARIYYQMALRYLYLTGGRSATSVRSV